jgi:hypothetical protein
MEIASQRYDVVAARNHPENVVYLGGGGGKKKICFCVAPEISGNLLITVHSEDVGTADIMAGNLSTIHEA